MSQEPAPPDDTDTAGVDDRLRAERDRLAVVLELLLQAVYETVPQDRWDGALRVAYGQAHALVFSDGAGFDPDRLRRGFEMLGADVPETLGDGESDDRR